MKRPVSIVDNLQRVYAQDGLIKITNNIRRGEKTMDNFTALVNELKAIRITLTEKVKIDSALLEGQRVGIAVNEKSVNNNLAMHEESRAFNQQCEDDRIKIFEANAKSWSAYIESHKHAHEVYEHRMAELISIVMKDKELVVTGTKEPNEAHKICENEKCALRVRIRPKAQAVDKVTKKDDSNPFTAAYWKLADVLDNTVCRIEKTEPYHLDKLKDIIAERDELVEELNSVEGDPNDDSDDPLKKLQYILAENGKLTTVIEELYTAYTIDGCIEESILASVIALVPGLK